MEDSFHLGIKALIRNKKGEVLVLKINPDDFLEKVPVFWDLPGGRIQKGETIQQAIEREVKEEIGVTDIEIKDLLDASISNMRINRLNVGLILFTYLCTILDPTQVKISDNEHTEFRWVDPQEAAEFLSIKFNKSLIDKIKKL